jgi:hypothetical protein
LIANHYCHCGRELVVGTVVAAESAGAFLKQMAGKTVDGLAGQDIGVVQPRRGDAPTLRDRANGQVFLKAETKQFDALNGLGTALGRAH